jgi:hypothetical protein
MCCSALVAGPVILEVGDRQQRHTILSAIYRAESDDQQEQIAPNHSSQNK